MNILHPDYSRLAARIAISCLHKMTSDSFLEVVTKLYSFKDKAGRPAPLIADDVFKVISDNAELIQSRLVKERDFSYDFFGFKTLERSYLLRVNGIIVERPQQLLMRVSIGIHLNDLESAFETYDLMS
jgi:ribonucleoside-diphosphate reductase alpha chain